MENYLFHGSLVSTQRILYTASDFARENLLHLQETGTLQANNPHKSSRDKLASFLFFLVEDGEGKLEYEDNTYKLKKNDCVFIDCSHPYAHYTSEKNLWKLKWAHFNGPTMTHIYEKFLERSTSPVFVVDNSMLLIQILDKLYQTTEVDSFTKDMEIQEQLSSLLTTIMKKSWHEGPQKSKGKKAKTIFLIKEYIDLHYTEKLSLSTLANQFFINKYYLARQFKQYYGFTVNDYVLEKRITHAKHLLRFTEKSIKNIAEECGFPDTNYFSRVFKSIEKISPKDFRIFW
ncbi:AraC family transcriptional regulator [Enterococcus italicus]|uniref:AraC family transcriptional regulator n=1 Tax=Enterococcus italicus TaxID=246144 RepID=UPI003F47FD58